MGWIRNPFSKPSPTSRLPDSSDVEAGIAAPPAGHITDDGTDGPIAPEAEAEAGQSEMLTPTENMTGHQFFYIFILDGLGAMILSGGINFAIAYAMYFTQDTERKPIRLWQLPNTLAGDAAVTIILQCIITWIVELILVNRDLRAGQVAPIGWLREPRTHLFRWFLFLDNFSGGSSSKTSSDTSSSAEASGKQNPEVPQNSPRGWFVFIVSQLLRGFLTAVPSFILLWGPSVGILTTIGQRQGGDWVFEKTWAPQVFKLLLGGILGLITTPFFATFWLVRAGWAIEAEIAAAETAAAVAAAGVVAR